MKLLQKKLFGAISVYAFIVCIICCETCARKNEKTISNKELYELCRNYPFNRNCRGALVHKRGAKSHLKNEAPRTDLPEINFNEDWDKTTTDDDERAPTEIVYNKNRQFWDEYNFMYKK